MLDKSTFKEIINLILVIGLFILAGLILFPIIYAIIYGILLGYILYPIHRWLLKKIKNDFLSSFFICIGFFIILIGTISIAAGIVFKQAIDVYLLLQKIDLGVLVKNMLPSFMANSGISESVVTGISSSASNFLIGYLRGFTDYISNLPLLLVELTVFIITFFYTLKDGKLAIAYIKSLSLLKKETEEKFFKHLIDVTNSVLIGQIFVGLIQGLVAGIGYYIFGVPNAILLTIITMVAAIIPVFGAWFIWVPIDLYLFGIGNTSAGIGLLIYGTLLISSIDNILRSVIISKRTELNGWVVLIGMFGGLLVFGFLGLLVGPLILAYVLLVIEVYRKNTIGDDLIFKKVEQ
ncbi:MAG: AI-2E family transporter [Candidatus Pacearchaeota archaeon]|jgi:predicted PurR-regulated permease PerM